MRKDRETMAQQAKRFTGKGVRACLARAHAMLTLGLASTITPGSFIETVS